MVFLSFYKKLTPILLICITNCLFCQTAPSYTLNIATVNEQCGKGAATLEINSENTYTYLATYWSTNQYNLPSVTNLNAGNYYIHVIIDQAIDTTINFIIEKKECEVYIEKFFTPNGDGFNDYLQIANIQKYPNFELLIFNKWGQQVHSQKNTYIPWNGTWVGINVPEQTYFYIFFYDSNDKNKVLKGDFTILR